MTNDVSLWEQFQDKVRYFNREFLNPLTLSFAGRQYSPYAIVQHTGRKSGRTYTTPVVARRYAEHFVIPLPYGDDVDWCRNVMASGKAKVAWDGNTYVVEDPQIVGPDEGRKAFPPFLQYLLDKSDTEKYLTLKPAEEKASEITFSPRSVEQQERAQRILMGFLVTLGAFLLLKKKRRKA